MVDSSTNLPARRHSTMPPSMDSSTTTILHSSTSRMTITTSPSSATNSKRQSWWHIPLETIAKCRPMWRRVWTWNPRRLSAISNSRSTARRKSKYVLLMFVDSHICAWWSSFWTVRCMEGLNLHWAYCIRFFCAYIPLFEMSSCNMPEDTVTPSRSSFTAGLWSR